MKRENYDEHVHSLVYSVGGRFDASDREHRGKQVAADDGNFVRDAQWNCSEPACEAGDSDASFVHLALAAAQAAAVTAPRRLDAVTFGAVVRREEHERAVGNEASA